MFKINIYLKFVAIVVGLLGGTALSFIWGFWYGFPFILIGLVALVSYFLLGIGICEYSKNKIIC